MTTSFRRPYQVVRRAAGAYVQGRYVPAPEPAPVGILATVQPLDLSRSGVYEAMQAQAGGRRFSAAWRVYTDSVLQCAGEAEPGDVLLYQGRRLLIVAVQDRHILGSEVSHYKYVAVEEIEKSAGESPL